MGSPGAFYRTEHFQLSCLTWSRRAWYKSFHVILSSVIAAAAINQTRADSPKNGFCFLEAETIPESTPYWREVTLGVKRYVDTVAAASRGSAF